MIEFVVGAGFRNAPTPVAGDDRLRRAPHRLDPLERLRAEQDAADRAENQRRGERPGEGREQRVDRPARAAPFVGDDQRAAVVETGDQRPHVDRALGVRLVALRLPQISPAGRAGRRSELAGDQLAVGVDETIGERTAAGGNQRLQPVAAVRRILLQQRRAFVADVLIDFRGDLGVDDRVDDRPENEDRDREQRQIDRRKAKARSAKQPSLGHAAYIRRRAGCG